MTVTPGTSGRVSINARGRDGSQSLAPRELYTADTLSVTAGDVVSLEAINVAATYTDPAEAGPALQALVSGAGNPFDRDGPRYLRRSSFVPVRVATFGDSRVNIGAGYTATTDAGYSGEKMPTWLAALRGDMLFVFNGGISGNRAVNWDNNTDSRQSNNQTVTDCIAATPDIVLIQYGINDAIAGTSAATIYAALQAMMAEFLGAGIFAVFESIYTCAKGPASYINGYSSAGGFSSTTTLAEYEARLAIMQSVNSSMQTWLAGFPGRALYVETNATLAASDGYAKTDGTWYDGTHLSSVGCRVAARLMSAALAPYIGTGMVGKPLAGLSRNALNDACITVASGRASGFSAGVTEAGTLAYSYQVVQDAAGDWCQEYTITNTTAAATAGRARFDVVPTFIGAATVPVLAAADLMQAAVDVYADNGAGAAPPLHTIYCRGRIYYNDASNEYSQTMVIAQIASTDHPPYSQAESFRMITPRRAIKAAMANANIITKTAFSVFVCMNQPGTVRVRLKFATWRKVG